MDGLEAFLEAYGLAAIFGLMLVKAVGVPIPIPADLIMLATAVRASEGKFAPWEAFAAILLAMVLGGLAQFSLARGPGRGLLYRFGRYLGLTAARLDRSAAAVQRGGPLGVGLSILTPGVRAASVAACGLAGLPLRTFLPGLVLGCAAFLGLHFFLGYLGGAVLGGLIQGVALPWLIAAALAVLSVALAAWMLIRRRQRPEAASDELAAEALGAWHEAVCPACLVLGGAEQRLAQLAPGTPVERPAGQVS